ncbi:MAG: dienelactone hydrolase family protein [Nocardioides sp.]
MGLIDSWTLSEHTADGMTFPTYRKGSGPGVIVIHEIPGLTDDVIAFGDEVVAAGYTVVMPQLFGKIGGPLALTNVVKAMSGVCVRKEFTKLAARETTPMAEWLRSLARDVHGELGGPGVGALGMCFTGGFALAMMIDKSVAAPVLCQPSVPFPVGKTRAADLNLSPSDLAKVKARAAAGCEVLGLRFTGDAAVGTRFDTLTTELGSAFIKVEFPGRQHSTVTTHRQQEGVERVLAFFDEKLSH